MRDGFRPLHIFKNEKKNRLPKIDYTRPKDIAFSSSRCRVSHFTTQNFGRRHEWHMLSPLLEWEFLRMTGFLQ